MPRDVDISVGSDTSAAAAGFAELKNYAVKARTDITREFSQSISFGGLFGGLLGAGGAIAGLQAIVDKAHEIHHESERFGIDAQSLQLIGNAAKEEGISLDDVARGMNRMLIGGKAALENQTALRVDMEKFNAADPAGKFLLIADAVKEAGLSTESYDAIAKIFGARFGTQLIPLLQQGREEIEKLSASMTALSNEQVGQLEHIHVAFEQLKSLGIAVGAALITGLYEPMIRGGARINESLSIAGYQILALGKAAGYAATLQWGAAKDALHEYDVEIEKIRQDELAWEAQEKNPATPKFKGQSQLQQDIAEEAAGPGGKSSPGGTTSVSSGSSGSSDRSLTDQLAAKQRRNDLEQLTAQQKLETIQKERNTLQDELYQRQLDGNLADDTTAAIQAQILDKDHEIAAVKDKIDEAQKKYNADVEKARQAAEDEAAAVERKNLAHALTVQYGAEIADGLIRELELEDQIKKVTDDINQAWAEGDQTLAETLTKLRDQLDIEKQTTLELNKQNAARAASEARLKAAKEGFGINPGSDSQLAARAAGISGGQFGTDIAGGLGGSAAERAKDMIALITGHNRPWLDLLRANQNQQREGDLAATGAIAKMNADKAAEIAFWQAIASGRWSPQQVAGWSRFANLGAAQQFLPHTAGPTLPASPASTSAQTLASLQQQISLLTQQLAQLQLINGNLRPAPGGH